MTRVLNQAADRQDPRSADVSLLLCHGADQVYDGDGARLPWCSTRGSDRQGGLTRALERLRSARRHLVRRFCHHGERLVGREFARRVLADPARRPVLARPPAARPAPGQGRADGMSSCRSGAAPSLPPSSRNCADRWRGGSISGKKGRPPAPPAAPSSAATLAQAIIGKGSAAHETRVPPRANSSISFKPVRRVDERTSPTVSTTSQESKSGGPAARPVGGFQLCWLRRQGPRQCAASRQPVSHS